MADDGGAPAPDLPRLAAAFVRLLREYGVMVPLSSTMTYTAALGAVDLGRRADVYWAGRATLVTGPEATAYDTAFARFWEGATAAPTATPSPAPSGVSGADASDSAEADPGLRVGPTVAVGYSPQEWLWQRDIADCTPEEVVELCRWLHRPRPPSATRRTQRRELDARRHGPLDVRRTVRRALRTDGEALHLDRARPAWRRRRVVLLCDVSGSMQVYARVLLHLMYLSVASRPGTEVFALGTRLTRLTQQLRGHAPEAALGRAAGDVPDWSGGTRLGAGLRTFNDAYGTRGMARGAVVVIVSDGLDRGEPERLESEMARLHRVAHRLVWVNPLKASPGYEPLARGMAAALPHVDDFLPGHSLLALESLWELVVDHLGDAPRPSPRRHGSERTTVARLHRLRHAGVVDEAPDRVMVLRGLEIGARNSEETAVSINAGIIPDRSTRRPPASPRPLREPIHPAVPRPFASEEP